MANCPWQVEDKRRNKTLVTLPQGNFCHSSSTDSRNYNSKIETIYKRNTHYAHAPPAGFGESNQLKDSPTTLPVLPYHYGPLHTSRVFLLQFPSVAVPSPPHLMF